MKLLVLDNYDSFTYNLAHILRKLDVDFEVRRNDKISLDEAKNYDQFLFSPGPGTPKDAGILKDLISTYKNTKPMLGICLGHQAIAESFGGKLINLSKVYHGVSSTMRVTIADQLFEGIPTEFEAGRYHSWAVEKHSLPPELEIITTDDEGEIMAIRHKILNIRGVQFHPESIMSEFGEHIIKNFIEL
ncbi:glutamine amidotransferase of anthranilate synthase or aminodeoxychorismate synthase [Owenweeksia hongkongensis DSM 17368]|uniref:Glutamine amidotransferase of anthranilate synthase or aminodeoxychorismate synthase n=1 Tax=Owenweeksia hongkongensis (strain DSM 17368 / CIP 108786 / JCM 12287 / NRRL B-23963 / UST20020801) TaxID=926562 RepID=G8R337_OWEHD|nr:aminodeoxychorismate/anthranilate synthase component II [Owenweeksia hongkongensis]AEV34062.1 glutamine amidotransferase of anthranilate synthase or aminodeoxychorismate synthase [Owenweeksia hongkongensis DSM 17368]